MNDARTTYRSAVSGGEPGGVIISANAILTSVFVATATVSAVVFADPWKAVAVVAALVCFSLGVVAFLWGYWNAVQRSREENIGVASLYFLTGGVAPRGVSRAMNACLTVQAVVGLVTALARNSTDGKPGSTLAFGILVPMLGLGLNGLWGAFHGTFEPRMASSASRPGSGSSLSDSEIPSRGSENGQDTDHD